MLKKLFSATLLSLFLFVNSAFAVGTVLPNSEEAKSMSVQECLDGFSTLEIEMEQFTGGTVQDYIAQNTGEDFAELILSCAIKTGKVKFWMLPYFISRILTLLISLSGLIAVLMIIIGGYYYIAGGLNEDKEKGKTIIRYALLGFVLVMLAWIIVNAILLLLTS